MRFFALTLGFYFVILIKVHCQKYNGPRHKRTNGLNEEIVQLKTELQQLKQGSKHMKRQLHHVTKTLKGVLQERDTFNLREALQKAESKSSVSECILFTTDTETNAQINVINSRSDVEWSTNLTLELQSIKRELDRMIVSDSAVRRDLLSTRSQRDMFAASVTETGNNVMAELTQLKPLLKQVVQEILSTRSEMKTVAVSSNVTTKHMLSMKSELTQFQDLLDQAVQEILSTRSEMKTVAVSSNVTAKHVLSMKSELTQFQDLLDQAVQEILSTRSELKTVAAPCNVTTKHVLSMKSKLTQFQGLLDQAVQEILSTRSEMKTVAASSNVTTKHVLSMKSELTQFQHLLDQAVQEILSTRSELKTVAASSSVTTKQVLSMKSKLTQFQTVMNKVQNEILSTNSEMKTVAASTNVITKDVLAVKSELTQFQDLLNQAVQEILSTKSELKTVQASLSELRKCPYGFMAHGDSCYMFSTVQGTFDFAASMCKEHGSHLAVVTSKSEDDFLRRYLLKMAEEKGYFLGGTDISMEGNWTWTGGVPFGYTNWFKGEPNDRYNNEDCLTLYKNENYLWNDMDCNWKGNFICEYPL